MKRMLVPTLLISFLLFCIASAAPQQRAGGRGGGGGFRQPDPIDFSEHAGWVSLFDGKTLNGWSGDENWKVEDRAIGQITGITAARTRSDNCAN